MAKKYKDYGTGIPRHEMEALARVLLPTFQEMAKDENLQKEFAEWSAAREKAKKAGKHTKA